MAKPRNPFALYLAKLEAETGVRPSLESIRSLFDSRGWSMSGALLSMWASGKRRPCELNQMRLEVVTGGACKPIDWLQCRMDSIRADRRGGLPRKHALVGV